MDNLPTHHARSPQVSGAVKLAAGTALLVLAALPAQALVSLNDGKDKIFVSGSVTIGFDSNFYANSFKQSETTVLAMAGVEYSRRAGAIGVDASVSATKSIHSNFSKEDSVDPKYSMELTKSEGPTTGSLRLNYTRRRDNNMAASMRLRTEEYGAALDATRPVSQRYSVAGGLGFGRTDFQQTPGIYDLDTFDAHANLVYQINSRRELSVGYAYGRDDSKGPEDFDDHGINVGLKGRITAKVTGTLQTGFTTRQSRLASGENFSAWTAAAIANWLPVKKTTVTGELSKSFATTSTDIATDNTTAAINVNRVLNARWNVGAGLTGTHSRYLGVRGAGRSDDILIFNASVSWSMNEHLRVTGMYSHTLTSSTLAFAEYNRDYFSLMISSRW